LPEPINALCLHYKDQVVIAAWENNYCLLWESYQTHTHTHTHTARAKCRAFNINGADI